MQISSAGYRREEPIAIEPEQAQTLVELFDYHKVELGYSTKELAFSLKIFEDELLQKYGVEYGLGSHLRRVQ